VELRQGVDPADVADLAQDLGVADDRFCVLDGERLTLDGDSVSVEGVTQGDWIGRWVSRVSDVEAGRLTGYVRSTAAVV